MASWNLRIIIEMSCSRWFLPKCKNHGPFPTIEAHVVSSGIMDVATSINSYPTLDISHEHVKGECTVGTPIGITTTCDAWSSHHSILQEAGELVACWRTCLPQLLAIKRVMVTKSLAAKFEFMLPKGTYSFKLCVICDCASQVCWCCPRYRSWILEGEDSGSGEDE